MDTIATKTNNCEAHNYIFYSKFFSCKYHLYTHSSMYKLDLPIDYKEAAAIERRCNMEEQRKSRIFNAQTRLIGIDLQAVDQQMKDNKQSKFMEKKRDDAFGMFN